MAARSNEIGEFMNRTGRRRWLESMGMLFVAGRLPTTSITSPPSELEGAGKPLQLADFQPRSMLHVPETKVPRPRYPVIDIHTHLSVTAKSDNGVGIGEAMKYFAPVETLLPLMDRKNIRVMVNLTGGAGKGLEEAIRKFQQPYPERFVTFTEPWWERTNQPGYSQFQADEIVRAHEAGAHGLKILKTLGLYLREGISKGPLVKIDDRRFDAMWETCGPLGMPVAIHVSDPEAFFLPIDRFNERFEELRNLINTQIGRFMGAIFPVTRNCSRHVTASWPAPPRPSSSCSTWAITPRIFLTWANAWTASPICTWNSVRGSGS